MERWGKDGILERGKGGGLPCLPAHHQGTRGNGDQAGMPRRLAVMLATQHVEYPVAATGVFIGCLVIRDDLSFGIVLAVYRRCAVVFLATVDAAHGGEGQQEDTGDQPGQQTADSPTVTMQAHRFHALSDPFRL